MPENFIVTYTGKRVSIVNPQPEDICLEDIAHSLSMQCRFNGHSHSFYSVAEHSTEMSKWIREEDQWDSLLKDIGKEALLHDAAEAYVGDMVRPLKNYTSKLLSIMESRFKWVIFELYGLDPKISQRTIALDRSFLRAEALHLMKGGIRDWECYDYPKIDYVPKCLFQPDAKRAFLEQAERLGLR